MENKNTIFRVTKNTNFTTICNTNLKDIRLSWGAKGLLTYLLTLPDDWKIYLNELTCHTKDGYVKTNKYIKELIEAGYIKREKLRTKAGTFAGYEYIVSEIPITENILSDFNRKPKTENGETVNGKTECGKSSSTKYLYKQKTNKQKTNNNTKITKKIITMADEIENTLKCSVNLEVLNSTIKKHTLSLDDIRYYLSKWNKFDYKTKDNPIAFLLHLVKIKAEIPKGKMGFSKPEQSSNFEQRVYDDEYFESLYENFR